MNKAAFKPWDNFFPIDIAKMKIFHFDDLPPLIRLFKFEFPAACSVR